MLGLVEDVRLHPLPSPAASARPSSQGGDGQTAGGELVEQHAVAPDAALGHRQPNVEVPSVQ